MRSEQKLLLVCLIATALAMSPVLFNGFVNWDDNEYVYQNPNIQDLSKATELFYPENRVTDTYSPFVLLSFALEYHFVGTAPFLYHFNNWWLHLLNTFLVFLLIMQLGLSTNSAFIVAMLFGIHPMHVESVAWISERKDQLYVLFYLLACLAYLKHVRDASLRPFKWLGIALLMFLFSLLSKTMAVTLPVLFLLFDRLLGRVWSIRSLIEKVPFFLLAIGAGILTLTLASPEPEEYSFWHRTVLSSYATVLYLLKVVFPFHQVTYYDQPEATEIAWYIYASLPILIVVLGFFFWHFKKNRVLVFGGLFFLLHIALVLHFLKLNPSIICERFSYLSYIGLFIIAAWIWENHAIKITQRLRAVVSIATLLALGLATFGQCKIWKDDLSFWAHGIRMSPRSYLGHCKLGLHFANVGSPEIAYEYFSDCIDCKSENAEAFVDRGLALIQMNRPLDAIMDLDIAIGLDNSQYEAFLNRGVAYLNSGQPEKALHDLERALDMAPENALCWLNVGLANFDLGRFELATSSMNEAIVRAPDMYLNWYYRAKMKFNIGDLQGALNDIDRAIRIAPSETKAQELRSRIEDGLRNG